MLTELCTECLVGVVKRRFVIGKSYFKRGLSELVCGVLAGGFPLLVCSAWSVFGDLEVPRFPVHGPLLSPSTLEKK